MSIHGKAALVNNCFIPTSNAKVVRFLHISFKIDTLNNIEFILILCKVFFSLNWQNYPIIYNLDNYLITKYITTTFLFNELVSVEAAIITATMVWVHRRIKSRRLSYDVHHGQGG